MLCWAGKAFFRGVAFRRLENSINYRGRETVLCKKMVCHWPWDLEDYGD